MSEQEKPLSAFDALVASLERAKLRRSGHGEDRPNTANLDRYVERKKQEAGSKPKEERS